MHSQTIRILRNGLWVAALATVAIGGCRCERNVAAPDDVQIDRPPLAELDPDAPRPAVDFPAELHLDDQGFNSFVVQALDVCRLGDYDGFRELFGMEYEPTPEANFRRVWHNVSSVAVRRIIRGPQQMPHYYVRAEVGLRRPDRRGQDLRDIWVMVYHEHDRWCLGAPSQDVLRRLRMLKDDPAEESAS
jgi:hypothetical protein